MGRRQRTFRGAALGGGALLLLTTGLAPAADDLDLSDWDWSAVEAEDSGPITSNPVTRRILQSVRPTPEAVTKPDLAASAQPAGELFVEMPAFLVIPSVRDAELYPCSSCHQWTPGNPEPRPLKKPHDNFELQHGLHGKGRFWCSTCHDMEGSRTLKTLEGVPLGFGEAYLLCSQCHVNQARDWSYGAHGKRLEDWRGTRRVYDCTACHYQHSPAWSPRQAKAGPPVRQGLERPAHWVPKGARDGHAFEHQPPWKRAAEEEGS